MKKFSEILHSRLFDLMISDRGRKYSIIILHKEMRESKFSKGLIKIKGAFFVVSLSISAEESALFRMLTESPHSFQIIVKNISVIDIISDKMQV